MPGAVHPEAALSWISSGGRIDPLPFLARAYVEVKPSPDGHELAAGVAEGGTFDVRLLDLDTHTDDTIDLSGADWNPVWAPDGRRIAVQTMRKGDFDTYVKDTTSQAPATPLIVAPSDDSPMAWIAPTTLLINQSDPDGHYRIKVFDITTKAVTRVLADAAGDVDASPDGRWIAFDTVGGGQGLQQVYVQSVGGGVPERITTGGGVEPIWSRAGHDLYYVRGDDILAAAFHEDAGRLVFEPERVFAHLPAGSSLASSPRAPMAACSSASPRRLLRPRKCGWSSTGSRSSRRSSGSRERRPAAGYRLEAWGFIARDRERYEADVRRLAAAPSRRPPSRPQQRAARVGRAT